MRSRIDFDLEDVHDQAAAISVETVESVAAVVSQLAASTDYGDLVGEGFAEAMITDAAVRHISR